MLVSIRAGPAGGVLVSGSTNWLAGGFQGKAAKLPLRKSVFGGRDVRPPFVDAAAGDYRLGSRDPAFVDRGSPIPGGALEGIGGKLLEFSADQYATERRMVGKPDLGAHEFTGRR